MPAAWIGLALAIGGAAYSASSTASAEDPTLRDPADDFRKMLATLENTGQRRYALEQLDRLRNRSLDLGGIEGILQGVEGGPRTERYWDAKSRRMKTRTVQIPSQKGLPEILKDVGPQFSQLEIDARRRARGGELEDLLAMGGQVKEAYAGAYPGQMNLLDTLVGQGQQMATSAGRMTPWEERLVQQRSREIGTRYGMGLGSSDAFREAVGMSQEGMNLQQRHLENAGKIASLYSAATPDPFLALTKTPFQSGAQGAGLWGQGQQLGTGGNAFNNWQGYMQNVGDFNANAMNAANISRQNNAAAIGGSLLGAGGQIGSSYFGRA